MRPADSTEREEFPWETAESRPIVSSKSKEAGEDYWIDDKDLERSIQRKQAIRNRKVGTCMNECLFYAPWSS